MDIITKINETAESIKESDLKDWLIPELANHYQNRIDAYGFKAYGSNNSVSRNAFREVAKETLFNGLNTFLFKKEHYRNGRDINSYLLLCLRRLSDQIFWDQSSSKRINSLVCPACKELGYKIFLTSESKLWRCSNCTSEINRLTDESNKSKSDALKYRSLIQLHKIFSLHTRKGYKCGEPSCGRFIPKSLNGKYGIQCPYVDCDFFGKVEELEVMNHPSALSVRQILSLNTKISNSTGNAGGDSTLDFQDNLKADVLSADKTIEIKQIFSKEYSILIEIIEQQIASIKRTNNNGTKIQKLLMYEAFKSMCFNHPEEMVSYLVHLKQSADSPIQVRIFQEYISLIENALPFCIERRGEKIEILTISDPYLGLFTGFSVYDAVVKENGSIPNNTIETYTGSREYKMFGPCFLGKLVDVVDKSSNKSLLKDIKSYSFVQIESNIAPETKVTVSHYRIPPHYEMGAMVFLQRIRRNLVDKIYFRLNGTKRKVGSVSKEI
jgi:ribosomal protein L37AE/L43A